MLVAGCAAPSAPLRQKDLAAYMQQLTHWAPQEAEIGRSVRRILETEFVDEAEVRRQVAESLPRVDAQLAVVRAYRPAGAELQAVHDSYVEAWDTLQRGYADILRALDEGDQAALGRGRQALLAWRHALPATARRLRELADATNAAGPPT